LGNKSPNTLKSPDKEVHEDGEKSCSASTKKILVVKPHIGFDLFADKSEDSVS